MKKQQLILAYYTFFVSLLLFFWAVFFSPKPEGFLLSVLFIPTSLYFFSSAFGLFKINPHVATEAAHEHKPTMIPLVILLTLFISSVSILVFTTLQKTAAPTDTSITQIVKQLAALKENMPTKHTASEKQMLSELKSIKEQLATLKTQQKTTDATILGNKTTSVGSVTPKSMGTPVPMYQEKNISSPVVGSAEFGKNYTYIEKDADWYLIFGEKEGYVQSQFVKEVAF